MENKTKIGVYGVFDGHIGKFAAEYLQFRFPFQLAICEEFLNGDYENGISKSLQQIHESLLNCSEYFPEGMKLIKFQKYILKI